MKIAFVVNSIGSKGGIGRVVLNIASQLKKKGHEIQILTINCDSNFIKQYGITKNEIKSHKKLNYLNKLSQIPVFGFIIQIIKFVLYGFLLSINLSKNKPEIVNSHHYLCGISGWILSRILRISHVLTIHGIHSSKGIINTFYYWAYFCILHFLKDRIPTLISVDTNLKTHESFKNMANRIEVIYPCIDEHYLTLLQKNMPRQNPDGGLKLIFVGRLEKQKGLDELLVNLAKNISNWSELKIVGTGNYEFQLKKFVKKLNISNKVQFMGFLTELEKFQVMNESQIYISYSRSEGFPLVILEFLALGKPCIIYPVGGISYFKNKFEKDKFGFFLKPQANFLKTILTDPYLSDLFLDKICEARKQFVHNFYPDTITNEYLKIFEKTVKMSSLK